MKYVFFFLFPVFAAQSQGLIEHQSQVWYGYYLTHSLNAKWYVQGEAHTRHFVDPLVHHQNAFRAHVHHTIGDNWDLSAGAALFLNTPNDPRTANRLAIPEYRPHLDIVYKHRWSKVRLDHRFRSEMRFNRVTNATRTELTDDINFSNYRLRYRIQALFPFIKRIQGKVNTEILLNAAQENPANELDQHRMFAGVSIPLRDNLTVDVGYLHAFQQRPNLNYYDRSILSIMVYHRIP
ncbi:DUF2490 domain-containing protein [Aquirufa lenticrescens]|uniref:DUF2490 domain-containing protein n=1 Tax=Aquirufa lenticrescens TaxID=2696560 RepID=UPI001CAA510D|nr:DUF2490 domain-containing protein [Aquirufa lenticrescens]UAJ13959.1 DUF2490 domain-containing protein [Aquirufa lenticrescens]